MGSTVFRALWSGDWQLDGIVPVSEYATIALIVQLDFLANSLKAVDDFEPNTGPNRLVSRGSFRCLSGSLFFPPAADARAKLRTALASLPPQSL